MTEENLNSEIQEAAPQVEQVSDNVETQSTKEQVNNEHLKAMRLKMPNSKKESENGMNYLKSYCKIRFPNRLQRLTNLTASAMKSFYLKASLQNL